MRKRELTEFLAELTEFAAELSEFSSPKQYSRNSIPPVPHLNLNLSRSPKAGHNKAGRSDFRNQRFDPDTAEKQGSEEIPQAKNAENAENAEGPSRTRKI